MPYGFWLGQCHNIKTQYAEIIERIADATSLYRYQVKKVLDAMSHLVVSDLIQGKSVYFPALGKFWMAYYRAGPAFNPIAMKPIETRDRYLPKFKWGKRVYGYIKEERGRTSTGDNE